MTVRHIKGYCVFMTLSIDIEWMPCGQAALFHHTRGWGYQCEKCDRDWSTDPGEMLCLSYTQGDAHMTQQAQSKPWGTYILTVLDRSGVTVHQETLTGQSGTSMMDNAMMERRRWDRENSQGAPHSVDW